MNLWARNVQFYLHIHGGALFKDFLYTAKKGTLFLNYLGSTFLYFYLLYFILFFVKNVSRWQIFYFQRKLLFFFLLIFMMTLKIVFCILYIFCHLT